MSAIPKECPVNSPKFSSKLPKAPQPPVFTDMEHFEADVERFRQEMERFEADMVIYNANIATETKRFTDDWERSLAASRFRHSFQVDYIDFTVVGEIFNMS